MRKPMVDHPSKRITVLLDVQHDDPKDRDKVTKTMMVIVSIPMFEGATCVGTISGAYRMDAVLPSMDMEQFQAWLKLFEDKCLADNAPEDNSLDNAVQDDDVQDS